MPDDRKPFDGAKEGELTITRKGGEEEKNNIVTSKSLLDLCLAMAQKTRIYNVERGNVYGLRAIVSMIMIIGAVEESIQAAKANKLELEEIKRIFSIENPSVQQITRAEGVRETFTRLCEELISAE